MEEVCRLNSRPGLFSLSFLCTFGCRQTQVAPPLLFSMTILRLLFFKTKLWCWKAEFQCLTTTFWSISSVKDKTYSASNIFPVGSVANLVTLSLNLSTFRLPRTSKATSDKSSSVSRVYWRRWGPTERFHSFHLTNVCIVPCLRPETDVLVLSIDVTLTAE